jgi:membrane protein YqaA with SNARE-associated domain
MATYALALGCIFAVNLLPAFGPPTWAVLVFFRLNSHVPALPLVLGGAVAAASGRLALATGARRLRRRFPARRLGSLAAAEHALTGSRRRTLAGLTLFALSPVPSAQLFVAAGLLTVPLVPLTAVFFAGRLASYSFYVAAGSLAQHSLGEVLKNALGSPVGIAIQLAMLGALMALYRVDWEHLLTRRGGDRAQPGPAQPAAEYARHRVTRRRRR